MRVEKIGMFYTIEVLNYLMLVFFIDNVEMPRQIHVIITNKG